MRISDRHRFTKRVKVPTMVLLLTLTFYLGVMGNIYFLSGQPVTLMVAGIPLALTIAIADTIKEGDI